MLSHVPEQPVCTAVSELLAGKSGTQKITGKIRDGSETG